MMNAQQAYDKMMDGQSLVDGSILLDLDGYKIAVRSNSDALIEKLGIYFAHTLGAGEPNIEVIALDRDEVNLGFDFIDWKREPGKSGRKDAYFDLEDARLVQKVRTGMVFLQSAELLVAAGPALENDNQVINYINAQYMNHLQQNDALICHASGLVKGGQTLGMAGFSGGGKSTLMLHMLAEKGVSYLTNDRLFIDGKDAVGIPKLPRVNPGTILYDDNLRSMISEEYQAELKDMPVSELWHLEEKYDVFVDDIYGEGKITPRAELKGFLILNWDRTSEEPCEIKKIDIHDRVELLQAIMKSPGPFYQFKDGTFFMDDIELDPTPYLESLEGITIYEARGTVDFKFATRYCLENLLS